MPAAGRPGGGGRVPAVPGAPRRRSARSLLYFVREGIRGFGHNGLASAAAVTITMVTLVALGAATVVASTLDHLARRLESKVQMIVYLRDGLGAGEVAVVRARLTRLPGVTGVTYVSKDDGHTFVRRTIGHYNKDMALGWQSWPTPVVAPDGTLYFTFVDARKVASDGTPAIIPAR